MALTPGAAAPADPTTTRLGAAWPRRGAAATLWAWLASPRGEPLLLAGLVALALAVRYPFLWAAPGPTDEWREAEVALDIVREGQWPLTGYDPYIGALWHYLLAAAYLVLGADLRVPRLFALALGALTVVPTYLLGRELGGRLAGLLAGLLLLTCPLHVVVNSHVAWAHSATPLFTTTGCWLLAVAARRHSGWRLAGAGLAFGAAVQTHPTALVLVVGGLAYLALRGWWPSRRWLWLAAALFALGCLNELVFIAFDPLAYLAAVQSSQQDHGLACLSSRLVCYQQNLTFLALSLLRLPIAVGWDTLDAGEVLREPLVWLYAAALGAGIAITARRGQVLALCLLGAAALLLPLAQPASYAFVPDGRYAMPVLPPLYAALAAALSRPPGRVPAVLGPLAGALLALGALGSLAAYYASHADELAALQELWLALRQVHDQAPPGATVLLDERLERRFHADGVARNTLELLEAMDLDARYAKISPQSIPGPDALLVLTCSTYERVRDPAGLVSLGPGPADRCGSVQAARESSAAERLPTGTSRTGQSKPSRSV